MASAEDDGRPRRDAAEKHDDAALRAAGAQRGDVGRSVAVEVAAQNGRAQAIVEPVLLPPMLQPLAHRGRNLLPAWGGGRRRRAGEECYGEPLTSSSAHRRHSPRPTAGTMMRSSSIKRVN